MKKKIIILGFVFLIFVIIIIVITSNSKKTPINTVSPSPSSEPTPTTGIPSSQNIPADDTQFNQALTDINKQYPWYSKLPLDTAEYHVVYDFSENKFRIRIKNSITTNQIDTVVKKALSNLQGIGVKAPIEYYVLDASGNQL